jgi:predicted ATPase
MAERSRLITLIGPGGVGKTRLAEEALRALSTDQSPVCADGAYVVDLAARRAGEDLCLALLTELRLASPSFYGPPGRGPADDALVAALADRRVLLLLDNCEHLLDEVAAVVEAVLTRTGETTLLATSREALGVPGETTLVVGPLTLPKDADPDEGEPEKFLRYPAVRLFVDRACSAEPGFVLTEQNCADVARICRRLDGLPLPIELAAARVRALAPSQIADRLADRFRLLARGSRTVSRHRTLQAVIDWSYNLLDEPAKEVFTYLSVFRGSFSVSEVESLATRLALCPLTTVDLVIRLVDKSLVQATPAGSGPKRYRMLETVREYAAGQLAERGQAPAVRRQHAELYVELAESQSSVLRSTDQSSAIRRLEREDDNIRAAFDFCCDAHHHDLALRLVAALGWYMWMRGDRAFGWPGVARALNTQPTQQNPLLRARALTWSCHLGSVGHRAVESQARDHGQQARALLTSLGLTNSTDYGYCMFVSAFSAYREDLHAVGDVMTARALHLGTTLHDSWLLACANCVAGIGLALRGDLAESAQRLLTSAQHYRASGDRWGEHRALIWLSRTYEGRGDLTLAEQTAEDALSLVRSLELGYAVVPLLAWIARLRVLRGNEPGATAALVAVQRNRWWRSTSEGIGWITDCQALLAEARAQNNHDERNPLLRQAAELYGQAACELASSGLPIHALHSRCRQVIVLARMGEPTTDILREATQLAGTQSDRRAAAILLDTRSLIATDKQEALKLLAEADLIWQLTEVERSPQFAADVRHARPPQ